MEGVAMTITYHKELMQGSDEWLEARRGLITASEMSLILTPKLKIANNDKTRTHVYELLAQRVTGYVEPSYIGEDMLRGQDDEQLALSIYHQNVAEVEYCGFITNDKWGFTLGYSPDALVGDNGLAEVKSRRQKYQMKTFVECVRQQIIPEEYALQCQTGLLVTEREWLDFISYSGGMRMPIIRVYPDPEIQDAIIEAATAFEQQIATARKAYHAAFENPALRSFQTERTERDMI
jgi:predicted phage-related endonuclease